MSERAETAVEGIVFRGGPLNNDFQSPESPIGNIKNMLPPAFKRRQVIAEIVPDEKKVPDAAIGTREEAVGFPEGNGRAALRAAVLERIDRTVHDTGPGPRRSPHWLQKMELNRFSNPHFPHFFF